MRLPSHWRTAQPRCDLLIENISPRVMDNFGLHWDTLHATNPRLSMVPMPAFGLGAPWRDHVGFAQTMEQASGMAWMTGPADGEPIVPRGLCDPIAGVHAAFAGIVAREVRDCLGHGIQVEAVLNVAAEALIEALLGTTTPAKDGSRWAKRQPPGCVPLRRRGQAGGVGRAARRRLASASATHWWRRPFR